MKALFIIVIYVITSFSALTFSSTLKSIDGTPIPIAFIKEKNSIISTISDKEGNFVLKPHSREATFVISKVGYQTIEVRAREVADVIFLQPILYKK